MDAAVETPKARRIYLLLHDRIGSGTLSDGDRLPGEPALALEFGVSRMTVRRALDRLVHEGMLERRAGVGTFVRDRETIHLVRADLSDVFAHLREMGRRSSVRLISFAYVCPPDSVATALRLQAGGRTQRSERVRLMDGAPFSYLTTHVPERIGATYSEADLATTPLIGLLERSGVIAERATQTLSAALAGPDVAAALGLEFGAALLSLTRVVLDQNGAGVEHLHALYRPDRFSFAMDLLRTGQTDDRRWKPVNLRDPQSKGNL
jgi:GntR family transcriptional regulator